jgi:transposase-like protein
MKSKYTDDFKLEVIKDYYKNDLGIRLTASKWGLASKNYITRWEAELKEKGLITSDMHRKPNLTSRSKGASVHEPATEELRALRKQNEELRCALAFEKELNKSLKIKKK